MKIKIMTITLLILTLFCGSTWALTKLDLQTAFELAYKHNRDLKLSKVNKQYADYQVKEAYSAAYPVVNAVGSYSRYILIPELVNDFEMNGEQMSFKMALGRENNFFGSLELQQPVWIAGKIGLGVKIAKIYRNIAEMGVEQTESDLKMKVVQSYYAVVMVKEFYQLALDTREQITNHLQNTQAMYQEGVVSEYDMLRAEVELANFQPQVTYAEEALKMAREGLRILLGLPPGEEIELTEQLEVEIPAEIEIDLAVEQALESRADYKQIDLQSEMLKNVFEIEKRSQFWPSFFLTMTYQMQAQEDNFKFNDYFWGEGLSAGVSVSIPLFDGFKTTNRIQMAKVDIKRNEIIKSQMEEGIRLEVKSAIWQLQQAVDNLEALKQAVIQAEKGYAIAEVRYANGLSTQVELLDARLAMTQAQISELSAKYDIIVAKAALDRALGK